MGWLIALGILVLLGILPIGIRFLYNSDGARVSVLAGPAAIPVFPQKKKTKKEKPPKKAKKKPTEKKPKPQAKPKEAAKPKEKGGPITDFLPLVYVALDFLSDFRLVFRVNVLELKLTLAGGDPCDLATNYGKACAAMGILWPRLEEWLVIRRRNIQMQCDFEAEQTLVEARLDLTLTLARLLGILGRYSFKAIRELIKIKNHRKGGAAI
jgi:hypothetical protein